MGTSSSTRTLCAALLVACAGACREDGVVRDPNRAPTAVARVLSAAGERADAGEAPHFAFDGEPVAITLDASESSDPDGTVVRYRWLSGTEVPEGGFGQLSFEREIELEDGGTETVPVPAGGRLVPAGEAPDWPADVERPEVRLGEGVWTFVLWVQDDDGVVGAPDAVTFTVGEPAPPEPPPSDDEAVLACIEDVVPSVSGACKQCVCSAGEECRLAADPSVCGEPCWALLDCIGMHCPDFSMSNDVACLMANCADVLTAGAAGAQTIAPCIGGCLDACRE